MPFWRAVDNPDIGAIAPEIIAHLLKPRPIQECRRSDETNDAGAVSIQLSRCGGMPRAKHLPRRPPPKIDIEILEMLQITADTPLRWRRPKIHRSRTASAA